MTQPTAQELAEMLEQLSWTTPKLADYWDTWALLERWHHSQLVFVTTPREWSVK